MTIQEHLFKLETSRWLSFLVGFGFVIGTLFLWQAFRVREQVFIDQLTRADETRIVGHLTEHLRSRILTLVRMAQSWELKGPPHQVDWETEALLNVRHLGGYQSIAWADPTFHLRWIAPPEGNQTAQSVDLGADKQQKQVLETSKARRSVMASPPVDLTVGGRGFWVCVPIFYQDQFNGFMVGSFPFEDMILLTLNKADMDRYRFVVFQAEEMVFQSPGTGPEDPRRSREEHLDLYNLSWKIKIWPKSAFLVDIQSNLPEAILVIGFLIALLLGLLTTLIQTVCARTREMESSNYLLEQEIAERKQIEQKLVATNKQMEKMAALKDEFVSKVNHELRTPLTSIKEGLNLILDGALGETTAEQKDFLKTMDGDLDRLTELINNMLDIAKMEAGRMRLHRRRANLAELIRSTVKSYQAIQGQRTILLDLPPTADVFVDTNRILQVIGNLFTNAIKYTREDGTIRFILQQQDGMVEMGLQDDGDGIAPEDLPKLFQKFSQVGRTASDRPRGTGLGLVVVKEMVELHEGRVEVNSKMGKGSTFTFRLPAYSEQFALQDSFTEFLEGENLGPDQTVGLVTMELPVSSSTQDEERREELQRLLDEVRRKVHQMDMVFRIDPSWVVIFAVTDADGVKAIVHRLGTSLTRGGEVRFGTAVYPTNGTNPTDLFQLAIGKEKSVRSSVGSMLNQVGLP